MEPLCRAACLCYVISHWLVPDAWKGPLWRGYLSDTLLIPAALPWFLWLQRKLRLRAHDEPPRWSEILGTLCIWAFAAEVVAPWCFARATGDPWDGVAYALGAVTAGMWWHGR